MQTESVEYQQKYTCFIDVLGFSDAISNPEHPHYNRCAGYFLTALNILDEIVSKSDFFLKELQVSQFSDCVVFSCDINDGGLSVLLDRAAQLQRELLKGGLLSRGAIAKGSLYHTSGRVFGPALVEAVNLEKIATTPRIILSPDVAQNIDECFRFKITKESDYFHVQYISNWGIREDDTSELEEARKTIEIGLENKDAGVMSKYLWLASQYNKLVIALSALPKHPAHGKISAIPLADVEKFEF